MGANCLRLGVVLVFFLSCHSLWQPFAFELNAADRDNTGMELPQLPSLKGDLSILNNYCEAFLTYPFEPIMKTSTSDLPQMSCHFYVTIKNTGKKDMVALWGFAYVGMLAEREKSNLYVHKGKIKAHHTPEDVAGKVLDILSGAVTTELSTALGQRQSRWAKLGGEGKRSTGSGPLLAKRYDLSAEMEGQLRCLYSLAILKNGGTVQSPSDLGKLFKDKGSLSPFGKALLLSLCLKFSPAVSPEESNAVRDMYKTWAGHVYDEQIETQEAIEWSVGGKNIKPSVNDPMKELKAFPKTSAGFRYDTMNALFPMKRPAGMKSIVSPRLIGEEYALSKSSVEWLNRIFVGLKLPAPLGVVTCTSSVVAGGNTDAAYSYLLQGMPDRRGLSFELVMPDRLSEFSLTSPLAVPLHSSVPLTTRFNLDKEGYDKWIRGSSFNKVRGYKSVGDDDDELGGIVDQLHCKHIDLDVFNAPKHRSCIFLYDSRKWHKALKVTMENWKYVVSESPVLEVVPVEIGPDHVEVPPANE